MDAPSPGLALEVSLAQLCRSWDVQRMSLQSIASVATTGAFPMNSVAAGVVLVRGAPSDGGEPMPHANEQLSYSMRSVFHGFLPGKHPAGYLVLATSDGCMHTYPLGLPLHSAPNFCSAAAQPRLPLLAVLGGGSLCFVPLAQHVDTSGAQACTGMLLHVASGQLVAAPPSPDQIVELVPSSKAGATPSASHHAPASSIFSAELVFSGAVDALICCGQHLLYCVHGQLHCLDVSTVQVAKPESYRAAVPLPSQLGMQPTRLAPLHTGQGLADALVMLTSGGRVIRVAAPSVEDMPQQAASSQLSARDLQRRMQVGASAGHSDID